MERYTEILKLKEMLEKANIPFEFTDDLFGAKQDGITHDKRYPAYQIRLNKDIDVVQHCYSYGEEKNLLEIMGGLTEEEWEIDGVLGCLTAEEVFKRFKYCYENDTAVYKAENSEIKTKQEQIEELVYIVKEAIRRNGIYWVHFDYIEMDNNDVDHAAEESAKELYFAGYRKANEVIDKFVERVFEKIRYEYENYPNAMTVGTYHQLRKEIKELADEMREEVKDELEI